MDREIVQRFPVQPGLAVVIEDSMNILLELTTPDGAEVIARTGPLSNCDDLKNGLDHAREWVAVAESEVDARRIRHLHAKEPSCK